MSRRSKILIGVIAVIVGIALAVAILLSLSNGSEKRALALNPTVEASQTAVPTATVLAQPTETPNVVVATVTSRPLPTATSESIASPTPAVSPTPKPTFTPTSSPTPTATPLPLELIFTEDARIPLSEGETVEGLTVFTGFIDGILDELKLEKPLGLKDAPEPQGEAYYGLFGMGPRYALAIMADIRGSKGSTIDGTLYVGRKLDGSLADAVVVPFRSCCADTEVSYSNVYDESGTPPPLDIGVSVGARNLSWIPEVPGPTPTPRPTPTAVSTPGSSAAYEVTIAIVTLSLRVGRIPGTEKVFILHDPTGRGVFNNLGNVRVLQDLDGNGGVHGRPPETQPASSAILIGPADEWKIYDIAVSGKFLHLIRKEDAEAAGLVSSK